MASHKEKIVKDGDDNIRLDRWLKENASEIPFALMQKLLRKGAIRVDGKRAKANMRLVGGQMVKFPLVSHQEHNDAGDQKDVSPKVKGKVKAIDERKVQEFFADRIIFQNKHVVAINKAHGLATQGGTGISISVDDIARQVEGFEESPRIVHRLDKDTSGVLLMALSRRASSVAMKEFKERSFQKTYWALIRGVPSHKEGKIDISLEIAGGLGGEKTIPSESEQARRAVTYYEVVETAGQEMCWVALFPESGRKHQIRAHLEAIGHPVVGDGKYGGTDAFISGLSQKMHLHARSLEHEHFLGSRLEIVAGLPPHMQESWKTLGFSKV